MKCVPQVDACERTDFGGRIQRIADQSLGHALGELCFVLGAHGLDDDEALRGDTALARVDEPSRDRNRSRLLNVCVLGSQVADKLFPFEEAVGQTVKLGNFAGR